MTQPVQEPGTQRSIATGTWNTSQLYRRPAPRMTSSATSVVHLFDWNYVSDNTIPNNTWTDVAHYGTSGGYYSETFEAPTGQSDMTFDAGTGIVSLQALAMYEVSGWVQIIDDPVVDNEMRAIAVYGGGTYRIINTHRFDISMGSPNIARYKLEVHAHILHGFGMRDIMLQVYQKSGSTLTFDSAELVVRRFETTASGDFGVFP